MDSQDHICGKKKWSFMRERVIWNY